MAAMGLTLPKLLLLVLVVWLVWRWLGRPGLGGPSQQNRDRGQPSDNRRTNAGSPQRPVEDMVKCPKCGAYFPASGAHDCHPGA